MTLTPESLSAGAAGAAFPSPPLANSALASALGFWRAGDFCVIEGRSGSQSPAFPKFEESVREC